MKVLITGATGSLGSLLCQKFISAGHSVRALCRPASRLDRLKELCLEIVRGDVTDPASVQRAIAGCEWVVHAAADLNYWRQDDARQMNVNVEGSANVAAACRTEGARLLHVSSVAAIGIPMDSLPADEDFQFNLEGTGLTYHKSKRRAEEKVLHEVCRGLDAVIVNPGSIERAGRAEALIRKVRRTSWLSYFSGGNCIVHPEDVVDGILAALVRGCSGERYILGGENLTFRAQAERVAQRLGLKRHFIRVPPLITWTAASILEPLARLRHSPPKIAYMVHYCANRLQFYDSSKARRELGYDPRDFDAILDECFRFPTASTAQPVH